MTLTPAQLGLARGLAMAVVMAIVVFCANVANISPVVGDTAAAIIASLALSLEHFLETPNAALFGTVGKR